MIGPGRKDDTGKVRVDLLPVGALNEVAKVLTFGADRYGSNNWQNVRPLARYYASTLRHLWARARGEKTDPESGLPHLAHAACGVLFLLSAEVGFDDPEAFEPVREPGVGHDDPAPSAPMPMGIGTGVRVRRDISDLRNGEYGVIERVENGVKSHPFHVRFPDGVSYWYEGDELEVVHDDPAPIAPRRDCIPMGIGTGVRVRAASDPRRGEYGVIEQVENGAKSHPFLVRFPGSAVYWYENDDLEVVREPYTGPV